MRSFCAPCRKHISIRTSRLKLGKKFVCPGCGAALLPMSQLEIWKSVLRVIGFSSYAEYLQSGLWEVIRGRVLERDSSICYRCRGPATQVHHANYDVETMLGDRLKSLRSVCASCHHYASLRPDGSKTSLSIANKKLNGTYRPGNWRRSRPEIGRAHAGKQ